MRMDAEKIPEEMNQKVSKKESPLARELPIKKSDIELRRGSSLEGDFTYINEPVISWSHVPAE